MKKNYLKPITENIVFVGVRSLCSSPAPVGGGEEKPATGGTPGGVPSGAPGRKLF